MLDENNLVTYEMSPEWFAVEAARRTMRRMYEAINRGDLKLSTVLNPAHDCIYHTFGVLHHQQIHREE